jgi:hypothetical protein
VVDDPGDGPIRQSSGVTTASMSSPLILVVSADPGRLGPEHRVDSELAKPARPADLPAAVERLIGAPRAVVAS